MSPLTLWLTVLGMGVITVLIRVSMILLLGRVTVPSLVQRALRYVPPAVLTAIIAPELFRPGGTWDLSLGNERLIAGVVAIVIAWRTKNVIWTVSAGMILLWLLS